MVRRSKYSELPLSLNLGTLRSRSNEVFETVFQRGVYLFWLQEVMAIIKDSHYKISWIWIDNENRGVGIPVEFLKNGLKRFMTFSRISDHLMMIKLSIDNNIITVLSCCTPQV